MLMIQDPGSKKAAKFVCEDSEMSEEGVEMTECHLICSRLFLDTGKPVRAGLIERTIKPE